MSSPKKKKNPLTAVSKIIPKLVEINDNLIYADIWKRPEMSPRDRSLITIAVLIAINRPLSLEAHMRRGIDNGLSPTEISELITHLAFYLGWPASVAAAHVAQIAFAAKKKGRTRSGK